MSPGQETPLNWAAALTAAFIAENLPEKNGCSVLDVGCGPGLIAGALLERRGDIKLIGIDIDEEDLAEAKGRGIDARFLDFTTATLEKVDAIIFSRSLHHLHPLDDVLARACSLLNDGGKIIIEEFGYELVDQAAAFWLFSMADLLAGKADETEGRQHGWLSLQPANKQGCHKHHERARQDADKAEGSTAGSAQEIFRHHHESHHEVSTYAAMLKALSDQCDVLSSEACPYLYRYICDMLPEDKLDTARQIQAMEQGLASAGAFGLCGRQVVATAKKQS